MFAFHRNPTFLNTVVVSALLGSLATAARADTIGFENDPLFSGGVGFHSVDSSHAAFSPVAGGALLVYPGSAFVGAGDATNVLALGPNLVQIDFDVPVSLLSFNVGGALPVGANAVLTLFNQGQQVGQQSQLVSSGLQSISFAGGPFTSATFTFSQPVSLFFIDNVHFESNQPPTANAGPDQTVTIPHDGVPGPTTASVTLDGSGSSDPDTGDTLTYVWKEDAAPVANGVNPTIPLAPGDHTITLVVTDSHGATAMNDVVIHVTAEPNSSPVANAGVDQTVDVSGALTPVALSGSGSDPDGDPLAFAWSKGATPLGNTANLTVNLAPGVHTLTLTVTDSYDSVSSDTVVVSVLYSWSGVLPPINPDGTSVFKLGHTVPVKFRLAGASAGITNLTAHLSYVKVAGADAIGDVNEADPTGAATAGNLFRYDPGSGQYIFNWDSSGLTAGKYELMIDLGDGVPRTVYLGLR